jgi:hypothetical protein
VGNAADHVHAHIERAGQVGKGAGRAQYAILRKGHQLQVKPGSDLFLHVKQGFDRQQARIAHVHVGADRQQALGHRPVAVGEGALHQGFLGELRFELAPQGNAFEQGAALIDPWQAVGQRRVHMEVGVHKRWRDELAGGVDDFTCRAGQGGLHGGDAPTRDADVEAAAAVGKAAVAQDQVEHGFIPSGVGLSRPQPRRTRFSTCSVARR